MKRGLATASAPLRPGCDFTDPAVCQFPWPDGRVVDVCGGRPCYAGP